MKIFRNFNKTRLVKAPNIRKKLIQFTSFLLLCLITLNIILYYFSMRNTYIEQLESSNDSIIEQVAISYEMVMKYIKDSVYKTALYDKDLITFIQSYDNSYDNVMNITGKLNSIVLLNEFIQSAYLYFPKYDQVYSTTNNVSRITTMDEFSDKAAFDLGKEKSLYSLDPHIVNDTSASKQLIISVVSSVPLYNQENRGLLVVNVDASRLYYDALKKLKAQPNMNFYLFNSNHQVIINKNMENLFEQVNLDRLSTKISYKDFLGSIFRNNVTITSVHYSEFLKWNFVLETSVRTNEGLGAKLTRFITFSLLLIIFSLAVLIFIILFYTKPVKGMIQKYGEKLWKDVLTDNVYLTNEVKAQLEEDKFRITDRKFGTISIHIQHHELNEKILNRNVAELQGFISNLNKDANRKIKVIITNKDQVAIIVSFSSLHSHEECESQLFSLAQSAYDKIDRPLQRITYLGLSTIKDTINLLPVSYKESMEMFKHKLCCKAHILSYSLIKDRTGTFEYPYTLERQLINNLLVGNSEGCKLLSNGFFDALMHPDLSLEDSEIISCIYQLQNSILKNISGLPIPIKIDSNTNFADLTDINEIIAGVDEFINKVCTEINKKDENEEYRLHNTVMEYVEKKFMQEDFCMNKAADDLSMNRNYLSKIIKEKTGENFTDYVNKKRIIMAKELLQIKSKTIEDVAKEVGYNYSYYFIKIFKNIEGITPGQYRNNIV